MRNVLSMQDLLNKDFDTVIVAAPDMHGRLIGKRLAPKRLAEFAERGVAVSACTFGWDLPQNIGYESAYAGWHTGWRDFLLIPDMSTLVNAARSGQMSGLKNLNRRAREPGQFDS